MVEVVKEDEGMRMTGANEVVTESACLRIVPSSHFLFPGFFAIIYSPLIYLRRVRSQSLQLLTHVLPSLLLLPLHPPNRPHTS